KGESSMVAADAAIDFIRKYNKFPQPFLAVVWFGSPHDPHEAIESDRVLYKDQTEKLQHYYGEVTGMDRAFGKLRKELRNLDIHENTILWYCSDNGGLDGRGVTGGRAYKGHIYEGGLRVPAILEWPTRIKAPRITDVPCNTTDIFPTLVDITGVQLVKQLPLDGISLTPLIDGKMKSRPKPMGFWNRVANGISVYGDRMMASLLEAQKAGKDIDDVARLRLDAGKITEQYPDDTFPGHCAWLDWPWKLHRIEEDKNIKWELYDLAKDPMEANDLIDKQPKRIKAMKIALKQWLISVVNSTNGKDYE
ncbi:MAG: sulfatase family protein, partial [Planctomycetota bacterium]